jgi:putative membrane protein
MMWWHFGGWGWGLMALWMILIWGGIIALIVWGVRRLSGHHVEHINDNSPLEIAKIRYAKGEITKEQYEQIKKDLSG